MSSLSATIGKRAVAAWPWLARALMLTIIAVVSFMLFKLGRQIDWREVYRAAREISAPTLALSGALVCAGYLTYASVDCLARKYIKHSLAIWETLAIAATSYAINVNLGVLLGGVGVRLRLYRKLGLRHTTAAQVVLFGTVTNWLGYCWLAGALFVSGAAPAPTQWGIQLDAVRLLGAAMLIVALGYLVLCATSRKRHWHWREHRITLPSVWMALAQSGLAMLSWCTMGLIVYILLERQVGYPEVLSILLFCSVAAIIAHIPGGLGVTEAIFVAALASRLPGHEVLAALLMYRVLYQLLPLCVAVLAYIGAELRYNQTQPPKRVSKNGTDRTCG